MTKGKSMAMIVGALTWLQQNKMNFALKFEETSVHASTDQSEPGAFKFPAWFTDSKHRLKQFEAHEQKIASQFDEEFKKVCQPKDFQALSQLLTKEDLELIKAPGKFL